jgi:hypothetical protein
MLYFLFIVSVCALEQFVPTEHKWDKYLLAVFITTISVLFPDITNRISEYRKNRKVSTVTQAPQSQNNKLRTDGGSTAKRRGATARNH